jgi:mevalonate kinase
MKPHPAKDNHEQAKRSYSAKLMLFGEYTVICGSMALMMPLNRFSAHWSMASIGEDHPSVPYLKSFFSYLTGKPSLNTLLDHKQMEADLSRGLIFASDIPIGYGAGSSGALVAAVYQRYSWSYENNLVALKSVLADMESYFHGQSSGLDPLCIYLNKPFLVLEDGNIQTDLNWPCAGQGDLSLFLADTGTTGMTGPLVAHFRNQLKNQSFYKTLSREVIPATRKAIYYFLEGDTPNLFEQLKIISAFQLTSLQPMIPEKFREFWKSGLESGLFVPKLCGSGGGGFILGFTKNRTELDHLMSSSFPGTTYFYL